MRWMIRVASGTLMIVASATVSSGQAMDHHHMAGSTATLKASLDKGDMVFELGPIDLPAHSSHENVKQPPPMAVLAGADGWLRGYSIEIIDSTGRVVPQRVVNHINVIAPQKRELFSPVMLRLAAAGAETSHVGMPWMIGYRVSQSDTILVSGMFQNPTDVSYPGARVRVRMPFSRAHLLGTMSIFPFYMDVMPPAGSHSFHLPVGRSVHSWEGSPAIKGRILGLSGHLHKYGVSLKLEDRTDGKVIWEGRPGVDSTGEVVAMPIKRFVKTFGVGVSPDHIYRLTAVYDNPTGAPVIDGGTGALGGVFLPGGDWPAIDRTNAEYQLDWRITYRLDTSRDVHGARCCVDLPLTTTKFRRLGALRH